MVNLEEAGLMLTIFLMIAGSLMAVMAQQTNLNETFGFTDDLDQMAPGEDEIELMIDKFNQDINAVQSRPDLVTQVWFGGQAIVSGASIMIQLLAIPLLNWTVMVDMMFVPVVGTPAGLLALPIKIFLGFVMIFTIITFLGRVIRMLPFFGGR